MLSGIKAWIIDLVAFKYSREINIWEFQGRIVDYKSIHTLSMNKNQYISMDVMVVSH